MAKKKTSKKSEPKILTPDERWEKGIDHDDRSCALVDALIEIDEKYNNGHVDIRVGGDGDNGEELAYLLDIYYELQPKRTEFALSPEQTQKLTAWQNDRKVHKKCHSAKTDIGGSVSYSFTPTAVGIVAKASCAVCKNEIDLSDYDNW